MHLKANGRDPRPALTVYLGAVLGDPRLARFLGAESRTPALSQRQAAFGSRAVAVWFSSVAGADDHSTARLRARAFAGAIDEVTLAWTNGEVGEPAFPDGFEVLADGWGKRAPLGCENLLDEVCEFLREIINIFNILNRRGPNSSW